MPIEIRELVIKTTIGHKQTNQPEKKNPSRARELENWAMKEEIMRECMDKIKEWVQTQSSR